MQLAYYNNIIKKIKNSDIFETMRHSKNYFLSSAAVTVILGEFSYDLTEKMKKSRKFFRSLFY